MQISAQNNKNEDTLCYNTGRCHYFSGRSVGYIDNKQFASIIRNPRILGRKLNSMASVDFCDLISKKSLGLRLVFITKDKYNSPYIIFSGIITETNNSVDYNGIGEISFVDNKRNLFYLEMGI